MRPRAAPRLLVLLLGAALLGCAAEPGPFGTAECSELDPDSPPVSVTVQAEVVDAAAAGLDAGGSVTTISGYAAEDLHRCDVVQVALHFVDTTRERGVSGSLARAAGPVVLANEDGEGQLNALDFESWYDSLPEEVGHGAVAGFSGWYVMLVDPVPGRYAVESPFTVLLVPGASPEDPGEQREGVVSATITVR
ncbi:hypothetical protein [Quadrisphaera sp. DSM 44207]|uniref:hypothetical protein n=1 Tax=Quadrisphaera sp. DSM 44207 TaxID=1881057 RepID=UPI000887B0C5|nr:hypothetical protein [Quadrisphaera sp. DSM 44207]SDQ10427.1 hypothetical protein SAMN05428996_0545 [Quadrisphaera sp. DSM 44207]